MPTIFRDKVTIGSLVFNDREAGGTRFNIDILDGWKGTPSLSVVSSQRGSADGAVFGRRFPAQGRQITVGGWFAGRTRDEAEDAWHELISKMPANQDIILTRYEKVPKRVVARLSGSIDPVQDLETSFRFMFELISEDPYKYSQEPVLGSSGISGDGRYTRKYPRTYALVYEADEEMGRLRSLDIYNDGTQATDPLITLYGPVQAGEWRILNETTGEFSSFLIDVGRGQNLVMDHKRQTAELNGYPVTVLMDGEWWQLAPGRNSLRLINTAYDPDAGMDVFARPAWR